VQLLPSGYGRKRKKDSRRLLLDLHKISCISYRNTISVRKGSFFEEFRLPLADIFAIIILWAEGKQIKDIIIDYGYGKNTIVAIISKLRSIPRGYYCDNHVRLGGPGKICQIDESQFVHKIKHHRGRAPSSDVWVFGIADTSFTPAKCYMEIVPDRKARTLLPIIRRVCILGTTIQSDGWAAYAGIEQELGFEHKVVNHKQNFVDPITGVHTQNIESCWNKMKNIIKSMRGVSKEQLPGLLCELMFKDEFKGNVLINLVTLLRAKNQ